MVSLRTLCIQAVTAEGSMHALLLPAMQPLPPALLIVRMTRWKPSRRPAMRHGSSGVHAITGRLRCGRHVGWMSTDGSYKTLACDLQQAGAVLAPCRRWLLFVIIVPGLISKVSPKPFEVQCCGEGQQLQYLRDRQQCPSQCVTRFSTCLCSGARRGGCTTADPGRSR